MWKPYCISMNKTWSATIPCSINDIPQQMMVVGVKIQVHYVAVVCTSIIFCAPTSLVMLSCPCFWIFFFFSVREMVFSIITENRRNFPEGHLYTDVSFPLQEKEKLYVELKHILARRPGPEVAEQLQIYQQTLREKTKQLKVLVDFVSHVSLLQLIWFSYSS